MAPSSQMKEGERGGMESIRSAYRDACILVTGGTGFLGKALVEKLVRSCPQIDTIYLLVRPKKGVHPQQRVATLFDSEVFRRMKEEEPKWEMKVEAVTGDCGQPGLGMNEEDRRMLTERVSIVFHSAATVRFDEHLKTALGINVLGTKHILELAKEMTQLKALVHVSTAFANCPRESVDEIIYPPAMTYVNLMKMTESLDDKTLDRITPIVLGPWPNTYVFTKQIAEEVVANLGKGLPVAIFRPAIVVCSAHEPIPGWTDNLYGASGIMVGSGTGVLRTLQCDQHKNSDIVPVDLAVNAMIAVAWKTANRHSENNNSGDLCHSPPEVYNFVSSSDNPVTWRDFREMSIRHAYDAPPHQAIWSISLAFHTSRPLYLFTVFFLHLLPAFFIDTTASLFGSSTNLLKIQKKIQKFSDILAYFTLREWKFSTGNVRSLWREVDLEERALFNFDIASLDWEDFFKKYTRGLRRYVLKEDPATIDRARTKMNRFYWLHQILKGVTLLVLSRLSWYLLGPVFAYFAK